jgi:hypothetical protein
MQPTASQRLERGRATDLKLTRGVPFEAIDAGRPQRQVGTVTALVLGLDAQVDPPRRARTVDDRPPKELTLPREPRLGADGDEPAGAVLDQSCEAQAGFRLEIPDPALAEKERQCGLDIRDVVEPGSRAIRMRCIASISALDRSIGVVSSAGTPASISASAAPSRAATASASRAWASMIACSSTA